MAYFKVKLGDQDKSWAPHTVCKTCVEYLRRWTKGTKTSLKFGIPRYGESRLTMQRIVTSAPSILLASTGRIGKASSTPTFHLPAVQWLTAKTFLYQRSHSLPNSDDEATITDERGDTEEFEYEAQDGPQTFSQCELNDQVRDLSLSKISSELLAPDSKRKIYLARTRHEDYMGYFCQEEDLVYCRDVPVFLLNSALLNTIREIGDSSLTAASAL
ncbi:Uncharacterized protein FKW44_025380 [Caligus rogercresseyi]|uniref:Uncharacterized protein n=1 Tax=Caligus rogercresseyi TaxID=217165 RepID=A0A7T8GKG1_CALRO|nr:Uncharacterized protein FKW44_025380 [Caligus rogercresseyi]